MTDRRRLLAVATKYGTPTYVYDREVLRDKCESLTKHFTGFEIHYAVKANSNPTILKEVNRAGLGAEAVSPGELDAIVAAGFPKDHISFTCSSMTKEELRYAARVAGRVHLDSLHQLELWGAMKLGKEVSIRLNQGIGAGHHQHVITGGPDSKFGITLKDLPEARVLAKKYGMRITGLQQHVGSNVLDHRLLLMAARALADTARILPDVTHVDFGGGLGVPYRPNQKNLDVAAYGKGLVRIAEKLAKDLKRPLTFAIEPGRYIVAESGTLLVSVTDIKTTSGHTFVGVNSGFNHLVRPTMYGSYHHIENVTGRTGKVRPITLCGNVCESGDIFASKREMALPRMGDVLAIREAGAYGFSMSSHYNLRRAPREIMLEGTRMRDISFSASESAR
ncbi:MAG: diaminopimelate decarboxylase [Bacillota bacterium]